MEWASAHLVSSLKAKEEPPMTNIFSIPFGQLTQTPKTPATGDPSYCTCGAIFDGSTFCKICEKTPTDPSEVQKISDPILNYLISPPPDRPLATTEEQLILFCIDTSGSMSSQIKVPEETYVSLLKHNIPSMKKPKSKTLNRLEALQAAVLTEIDRLAESEPQTRVGLISFGSSVEYHQISGRTAKITDDSLSSYEKIQSFASDLQVPEPLSEIGNRLKNKVRELLIGGSTALGPALLFACSLASKFVASSVVLCTDGIANVGLGSIQVQNAREFYSRVGSEAKSQGVSVSVLTVKDTSCRLEEIGRVADVTEGTVERIDPANLSLDHIVKDALRATNVQAKIFTPPQIEIQAWSNQSHSGSLVFPVGNVKGETFATFGLIVGKDYQKNSAPVQVQISYVARDGSEWLTVYNEVKEITSDEQIAEDELDFLIVGKHIEKRSALLVQEGKYESAHSLAVLQRDLLVRVIERKPTPERLKLLEDYQRLLDVGEKALHVALEQERKCGITISDEHSVLAAEARRQCRSDETSSQIYQMKQNKGGCSVM